jgi:hypothetical protein
MKVAAGGGSVDLADHAFHGHGLADMRLGVGCRNRRHLCLRQRRRRRCSKRKPEPK